MSNQKRQKRRKNSTKRDSGITGKLFPILFGGIAVVMMAGLGGKAVYDYFHRSWDVVEPYRIVVLSNDGRVNLIQVDYQENTVEIINIPGVIMIDSPPFGKYRLESLEKLMAIGEKDDEYLAEVLSKAFGRKIRAVLWMDSEQVLGKKVIRSVGLKLIKKGLINGGNLYEQVLLCSKMVWGKGVRVSEYDMESYQVVDEVQDVDGYVLQHLNQPLFDRVMDDVFEVPVPARREFSIVVDNTTVVSGLARQWARILTHEGYDVIGEVSSDESIEVSVLWVGGEEIAEMNDFKLMQRLLPSMEVRFKDTLGQYRSEVVLRLGEDMRE